MLARCGNVPTTLADAYVLDSLLNIHVPNLVNDKSSSSFDNSSIADPQANSAQCPLTSRASMDNPNHMPNLPPHTF